MPLLNSTSHHFQTILYKHSPSALTSHYQFSSSIPSMNSSTSVTLITFTTSITCGTLIPFITYLTFMTAMLSPLYRALCTLNWNTLSHCLTCAEASRRGKKCCPLRELQDPGRLSEWLTCVMCALLRCCCPPCTKWTHSKYLMYIAEPACVI